MVRTLTTNINGSLYHNLFNGYCIIRNYKVTPSNTLFFNSKLKPHKITTRSYMSENLHQETGGNSKQQMHASVFLFFFHEVSKLVFITTDLDFDLEMLVFKIRKYEYVADF